MPGISQAPVLRATGLLLLYYLCRNTRYVLMNFNTAIGFLRLIAILEGISYLLFAITMPLKYWYAMPEPNLVVGMAHGILFMLYGILCLYNIYRWRWPWLTSLLVLAASLFPFATFVADKKVFLPEQQRQQMA